MSIEWHSKGNYRRFEPKVNLGSTLFVGLIADSCQLKKKDEEGYGDKDGVEQCTPYFLLYIAGKEIDTKGESEKKVFVL